MKKRIFFFWTLLFLFLAAPLSAQTKQQEEDARYIRQIYDTALTEASCYDWLYQCLYTCGR
ncbi:MAG: hypothetical protein AAFO02_09215, partial [Bacteroidota bacterium]